MDATGSVSEIVPYQKQPLYYSIVMHDKTKKQIIPIAEFVTTSQTQLSISGYLNIIRKILETNITSKKQFPFAPIFVTDFSWAIINSILDVFNRCNIIVVSIRFMIMRNRLKCQPKFKFALLTF